MVVIRAKVVVFGKKWLYSAKVVIFGQCSCIWASVLYSGKNWLYSNKEVVFWQKWLYLCKSSCFREKMDLFGQKLLHSDKVVVF